REVFPAEGEHPAALLLRRDHAGGVRERRAALSRRRREEGVGDLAARSTDHRVLRHRCLAWQGHDGAPGRLRCRGPGRPDDPHLARCRLAHEPQRASGGAAVRQCLARARRASRACGPAGGARLSDQPKGADDYTAAGGTLAALKGVAIKENQAQLLVRLAAKAELFQPDGDDTVFATITAGDAQTRTTGRVAA